MKTSFYFDRWQYSIYRGFILASKSLFSSFVNSVAFALNNLAQCRNPVVLSATLFLEKITRKTGIVMIRSYQKYLSPYKGFSCAHRVLYGSESCSQYVKRTLIEQDLHSAITLSRQRFAACKTAKIILRAESLEKKRRREKKQSDCQPNCNCSPEDCLDGLIPNCSDLGDCGSDFDCAPDCGDCDCDCG